MENNINTPEVNFNEVKKSYLWILFLASIGAWLGLLLKIYILNTFYVSDGPIGLPTAKPEQLWFLEFMQITIPTLGAVTGYLIEKRRNYGINIVKKIIGYLIIIPTILFVLYWILLSIAIGGAMALYYLIPALFVIGLCIYRKLT